MCFCYDVVIISSVRHGPISEQEPALLQLLDYDCCKGEDDDEYDDHNLNDLELNMYTTNWYDYDYDILSSNTWIFGLCQVGLGHSTQLAETDIYQLVYFILFLFSFFLSFFFPIVLLLCNWLRSNLWPYLII